MGTLSPYQQAASAYLMAGWVPFVLPAEQKSPPPYGITGENGEEPSEEQYAEWLDHNGNIGIRMTDGMIGIDIDRDKETGEAVGWKTFEALTKKLGPLPIDFVISNQADLSKGFTAFFNVPLGVKWKESAGKKIDIIQRSHRYQVAAPSIHPDGPVYQWRAYHTNSRVDFIPETDGLPDLPQAWIEYLTKPEEAPESAVKESKAPAAPTVAVSLSGVSCALMRSIVATRIKNLKDAERSRHDFMVSTTFAIISEAFKGHSGGEQALNLFAASWRDSFTDREREGRDLAGEFEAAVQGAKNKMVGMQRAGCGCGKKRPPNASNGRKIRTSASLKMWR